MILIKNFIKLALLFSSYFLLSCNTKTVDIPTYPLQKQVDPYYYNRYPVNYKPRSRLYSRPYNITQPQYNGYYHDYDYYYVQPYGYDDGYYGHDSLNKQSDLGKQ